jgi:hypothetical protein
MNDYLMNNNPLATSPASLTNNENLTEEFECINYKEFADKFPENDLLYSVNQEVGGGTAYLAKFWVDLNYIMEEGVSSLYAVTNM